MVPLPQGVYYSINRDITAMNAKSHAGLPKAIWSCWKTFRDVHTLSEAKDGNDITVVGDKPGPVARFYSNDSAFQALS